MWSANRDYHGSANVRPSGPGISLPTDFAGRLSLRRKDCPSLSGKMYHPLLLLQDKVEKRI